MNVIKISPRGYCFGVINALNMVQDAALDPNIPRPIHVLGMIVHNEHITKATDSLGVITIDDKHKTREELLNQIDTGTVIFTAHGISPHVKQKAIDKGLHVIDASCKDVIKTHDLMAQHIAQGFDVLYIGKKGHPEPEGALGVNPEHIHLISNDADLEGLTLQNDKILITNQTTMSLWDVFKLSEKIKTKFPTAQFIKEICNATQVRQEAVANQATEAELTIVVGDPKSNNTQRLAQISSERANTPAYRVGSVEDIDLNWLKGKSTVAVTSGASTPTPVTKEVITFLEQYDEFDSNTWDQTSHITPEKVLIKRR
ncbi:MAG TPA: 4-hydroxy-3-methylbut-2-enyl diphosphate reductase [Firmicutes bacterium]|nr:4-hydroxy-3-methylbut-2-enyl diphosphate reductase [Bacillota bacterium]